MRAPRSLPRIILCLFAGAVINIALAQAAGWWCRFGHSMYFDKHSAWVDFGSRTARVCTAKKWGKTVLEWSTMGSDAADSWREYEALRASNGDSMTVMADLPSTPVPSWCRVWSEKFRDITDSAPLGHMAWPSERDAIDIAIGWPFLSFSMYTTNDRWPNADTQDEYTEAGYLGNVQGRSCIADRILAWHPIFPGILFGSLAWGLAVWLPVAVFKSSLRAWRRRRGRCKRCGYDRRGLVGCPECGEAANFDRRAPVVSRATPG